MISNTCKTIVEQLGGNQTAVMVKGTYIFDNKTETVTLAVKAKCKYANTFRVSYDAGKDLYAVETGKVRGMTYTVLSFLDDVYADQLRGIVERETGLRTSLTKVYS